MQKRFGKINLVSGVAAIALFAGTGAVIGEQMMPSTDNASAEKFLAVARAMQEDNAAPGAATEAAEVETDGIFRAVTIPTQGVYRFEAPAGSGLQLYIDGALAIDTTGPALDGDDATVKALQTLSAGDHAIRIKVMADDLPALEALTFGALGSDPLNLIEMSRQITPDEGRTLAAKNASVLPTATASAQAPQSGGLLGLSGGMDKPAFSIGGSSSRTARSAPASASGGGSGASSGGDISSPMGGMTRMAALAPTTQSSAPSNATTSSGGTTSTASVPSISTGGGTAPGTVPAPGTPGAPVAPGTPTATPAPAPAPTPTPIDPGVAPTPETVQASPLTPPTDAVITQAVQLTSAGNVNNEVPNTGATLFGAVQSSSVFDIVNVAVSGSNRTTTVDVGPMTGQFAVRLFPEDFASGNEVQVTLTGANSASSEVEAVPVTYTVTAMPAQDGVSQALSRLTFGATPDLYARVRAIGFGNYVEEQLNPDSINDAAFNAMNPESINDPREENGGTLLRRLAHYEIAQAAFSEKQLQNVMAQFWANHFHAVTKDTAIYTQNIDDRAFYRENAFGNFGEMLLYSARSPLMSQYLDNDQNRFREGRENDGINENYGREILELHTVGVEANYTPADVDMVSRVFSGWRYERTNPNAEDTAQTFAFTFFPNEHDPQDKLIPFLNTIIPGRTGEAGVQEGEELIAILANHPSTRTRTCRKLVQLLVADEAPANFVQACAAAWGDGGDVEAMLRAILLDPAYIGTAEFQRNKAKTPFEYAVSTIRAFGARPDDVQDEDFWRNFRESYERAGQDFLRFPLPTGLPEVASAWLTSASMVAAYNEVTDVIEGRQNYGIDPMADITEAGLESAEEVAAYLLGVATADQYTLGEFEEVVGVLKGEDGIFEPLVQDETRALERALGLIVVSPSFQLQ
ncbi:MAG: DUF1800 family protein [Paracoccaceae bacterium]